MVSEKNLTIRCVVGPTGRIWINGKRWRANLQTFGIWLAYLVLRVLKHVLGKGGGR